MGVFLDEAAVQNAIKTDINIQNDICSALGYSQKLVFIAEDTYINGIKADFTVADPKLNTIKAIIECKGPSIGVTDYVRGIGQLLQYEYFCENKVIHSSFQYDSDFDTVYLFPSEVILNNAFNIGNFKYPNSTKILEINSSNKAVRHIGQEELEKLAKAQTQNLVSISQYYLRDNRVYEYYILLKYILHLEGMGNTKFNRKLLENKLKLIGTTNNNNWRNAFISVASLGLIEKSTNKLTKAGKSLAILDYSEFAYEIYKSYIKSYIDVLTEYFEKDTLNLCKDNKTIVQDIKVIFKNKDVRFLTQSGTRYLSSWLNIMRDDYGIVDFLPRKTSRTLNYNPSKINENTFKYNISELKEPKLYINKYLKLLQQGIL